MRWAEFYREFLSFEQCYRNLDIEMSNLNPFVTDMGVVKTQLEKLKVSCLDSGVRAGEVRGEWGGGGGGGVEDGG